METSFSKKYANLRENTFICLAKLILFSKTNKNVLFIFSKKAKKSSILSKKKLIFLKAFKCYTLDTAAISIVVTI